MSLGLLFSGQGQQQAGLPAWVAALPGARPALDALDAFDAGWAQRLADPGWASDNLNAQPLVTALALAAWQGLREQLPAPAAVAGYSVGEVAAFCAAGVYPLGQALAISRQRAALMQACATEAQGLLSVAGLPAARRAGIAARHGLEDAIRLSPDQAVVGGTVAGLAAAAPDFEAAGARLTPLAVRIASHTSAMQPAAEGLQDWLATQPFAAPGTVLVCNATGAPERRPEALRQALAAQLARTVVWDQCEAQLAERGLRCVLEIGPGEALARGWQQRRPQIPARALASFQSAAGVAAWVRRQLDA